MSMADEAGKVREGRKAPPLLYTPSIGAGRLIRDRFELEEEIGRGGFSVVYRARDLVAVQAGLQDPLVALKIIVAEKDADQDIVSLMHREARRLRDLVHPNIVRVYDMDLQGKAHFMVMEYLEGRSLAEVLRHAENRILPVSQVDRLVGDLSSALAFAHSRGVIHADLKPGNVFVERGGTVKLIDFNIAFPAARPAKTAEEDTVRILGRLGAVTPKYASPQRMAGEEPTEGDDIYSLAALTYVALAGHPPYGEKTAEQAVTEDLPEPTQPGGLSGPKWAALRRGLALDDASRTPTIERFAHEFTGRGLDRYLGRLFHRS